LSQIRTSSKEVSLFFLYKIGITNLVEKFSLHNKEKEGKELKSLFEMFKGRKLDGTVESLHHSVILMLLCIGESKFELLKPIIYNYLQS
jgi:hypothetical protein